MNKTPGKKAIKDAIEQLRKELLHRVEGQTNLLLLIQNQQGGSEVERTLILKYTEELKMVANTLSGGSDYVRSYVIACRVNGEVRLAVQVFTQAHADKARCVLSKDGIPLGSAIELVRSWNNEARELCSTVRFSIPGISKEVTNSI